MAFLKHATAFNLLGEKRGLWIHALCSAHSELSACTGASSGTENDDRWESAAGCCDVPPVELLGLRSDIRASTLNGRIFGLSPSSSTLLCVSPLTPKTTREWSTTSEDMTVTGAIHDSRIEGLVCNEGFEAHNITVFNSFESLWANNAHIIQSQGSGAGLRVLLNFLEQASVI